jgi:selenocysteine-specific elongation factor
MSPKSATRNFLKSVIVGTAGHIDHGKTALVKALTGIDADRLEEEKRRGITIDIGFAHLELPSATAQSPTAPSSKNETLRLGFVDVPGHERFVRNMLAGVGGIDVVLLVIAADEGIKPQTREHFDICRLLAVRRGITVLTKSDTVDPETLEVVRLEAEDFVRGSFLDTAKAEIVAVSSRTGAGLDDLRRELARIAAEVPAKDSAALFRLPIDRVFTMKGFGTVVTGTLVSGAVRQEEEVELFPAARRLRVRGVQVHGASAEQAIAGERTALNLAGVATEELARGMTLTAPGLFRTTRRADVYLSILKDARPLKDRSRVHLHAYTAETVAEAVLIDRAGKKQLAPGESGFVQLRTADPMLLWPGDHFILRQFSPVVTIGGGVVLDAFPAQRRRDAAQVSGFLETLLTGSPEQVLAARVARRGPTGLSLADAVAETGWRPQDVETHASALMAAKQIVRAQHTLVSTASFTQAAEQAIAAVDDFQKRNPLVAGISKEELRERIGLGPEVFAAILESLVAARKLQTSGEVVQAAGRGVVMKDDEAEAKQKIEAAFATAGLKVPALKEVLASLPVDRVRAQKIVTLLLRDRVLVKLSDDLVFHRDALDALRRQVVTYKATSPKIDVARFKDMIGVTRKYAIPLLEYLDRERVTRRVGDERVIL